MIWQDHLAHGAQVRIEAYPDRLRVTSPTDQPKILTGYLVTFLTVHT